MPEVKCKSKLMKRYKIIIVMASPVVMRESFLTKPTKENIMELLLEKIQSRKLDPYFDVIIEAEDNGQKDV